MSKISFKIPKIFLATRLRHFCNPIFQRYLVTISNPSMKVAEEFFVFFIAAEK